MPRYFYVKDFSTICDSKLISKLVGYYTDSRHYSFLPPETITREQAIEKIRNGEILFIEDGCYRQVKIKIVTINERSFLRIDQNNIPNDFLG